MQTERKFLGTCFLCQQLFSRRAIERHLKKCMEQNSSAAQIADNAMDLFQIKVSANRMFWLYFEMSTVAFLQDLDDFLRVIWLECCGHLSQFTIHKQRYLMDGSSQQTLKEVFTNDTEFYYEYDFGSTTELTGKVVDTYKGLLDKSVRVLARNTLPEFYCSKCPDSKAKVICSLCSEFCCEGCSKKHKCRDPEALLPIVNSPRMGVCGYKGEAA